MYNYVPCKTVLLPRQHTQRATMEPKGERSICQSTFSFRWILKSTKSIDHRYSHIQRAGWMPGQFHK